MFILKWNNLDNQWKKWLAHGKMIWYFGKSGIEDIFFAALSTWDVSIEFLLNINLTIETVGLDYMSTCTSKAYSLKKVLINCFFLTRVHKKIYIFCVSLNWIKSGKFRYLNSHKRLNGKSGYRFETAPDISKYEWMVRVKQQSNRLYVGIHKHIVREKDANRIQSDLRISGVAWEPFLIPSSRYFHTEKISKRSPVQVK